jgi:hypothetical protein
MSKYNDEDLKCKTTTDPMGWIESLEKTEVMKIEVWKGREFGRDTYTLKVNGFAVCGPKFPINMRRIVLWQEVDKEDFGVSLAMALRDKE